ncbi:hypothetical protein CTA1_10328 [Colletotrichum tanaceti]|uniref:Uncharacterized protein n=1 Tax=Colletotrichum tanaceti TaxID=1306861 RepID=A0A4V6DGB3_9PEZI|nr:hypothetical protein CTA1_10328 [Colletotrichum tanaceti]
MPLVFGVAQTVDMGKSSLQLAEIVKPRSNPDALGQARDENANERMKMRLFGSDGAFLAVWRLDGR